jgi:hypothetical protein
MHAKSGTLMSEEKRNPEVRSAEQGEHSSLRVFMSGVYLGFALLSQQGRTRCRAVRSSFPLLLQRETDRGG